MPDLPDVNPSAEIASAATRLRWGDLRLRVLSALVLAPVALACVWFGGVAWAALVLLMAFGLAREWARLCGGPGGDGLAFAQVASVVSVAILALSGAAPAALAAVLAGACVVAAVGQRASVASGVLYVGLTAWALPLLRAAPVAGRDNVLFLLLIVWASDIAAYAAGRLVGGRRLAPSISPGKTWSGAVGGLLGALGVGAAAAGYSGDGLLRAMLVAGGLGCVSQAGDLLESAIKRQFGVKDSGRLIPGHGGLLDRLDGLLAAAPAAALLAIALGRGGVLWQ